MWPFNRKQPKPSPTHIHTLPLYDWITLDPSGRIDGPNWLEEKGNVLLSRYRTGDVEARRKIVRELSCEPTVQCIFMLSHISRVDADGTIRDLASAAIRNAGVDPEDVRKQEDKAASGNR